MRQGRCGGGTGGGGGSGPSPQEAPQEFLITQYFWVRPPAVVSSPHPTQRTAWLVFSHRDTPFTSLLAGSVSLNAYTPPA